MYNNREVNNDLYVECPHCCCIVQVPKKELNCAIFRHGVMKSTLKPINPHASRKECEWLAKEGLIYGCGKPFKITTNNFNKFEAHACDYI